MTLLPVRIGSGACLLLGDHRLSVEGPLADVLPSLENQNLTAGLRPESWRVAPATNRNLPAVVSHSEVLGNEQLLTCKLSEGDHLVQVRADPDLEITAGQRLHLDPEPSGWRLFDRDGEAIRLPRQPASEPGPKLPVID